MATLTAEQKIERAHVQIMQSKKFRFYSGLTMIGKVAVDEAIPTAGTNGRDVWYGRKFVEAMPDKQVLFVVLHELSHIAWRHTSTYKHLYDKDPRLANCACDFVINLQILDQDIDGSEVQFPTRPDGTRIGLCDEKYRGMDVTQVFNDLVKEYDNDEEGDDEGTDEGTDGGGDGGNDDEGKTGHGRPRGKGKSRSKLGDGQFDEHDFDGAEKLTEKEKAELGTRVTHALHQGKQLAGKMGGEVPRGLQELVEPQVPWQEVLRDMVKSVCKGSGDSSWRRFNRRFLGADLYMPNNISHKVGRLLDATDTSGSIGGVIHDTFTSEVVSICNEVQPEGLDVLYWDWKVAGHEFYTETEYDSFSTSTKPKGGGGTDPNCIPAYMKEHTMNPEIVIVFTDGYFYQGEGDWSSVTCPIIWCVVDNPSFVSTTGKVIHIKT